MTSLQISTEEEIRSSTKNQTAVFCQGGTFATSRSAVHLHPLARYVALRDEVLAGTNTEAGHYMERAWFTLLGAGRSLHSAPRATMAVYTIDTAVWQMATPPPSSGHGKNNGVKLSWWMPRAPCKDPGVPSEMVCYWLGVDSSKRLLRLAALNGWIPVRLPLPPSYSTASNDDPSSSSSASSGNTSSNAFLHRRRNPMHLERSSSASSGNTSSNAFLHRLVRNPMHLETLQWTVFESVFAPRSVPQLAKSDYTCFLQPGASRFDSRVAWQEIELTYRRNLSVGTIALLNLTHQVDGSMSTVSNVRRQSQESDEVGRAWFSAFMQRWRERKLQGAYGPCAGFAGTALLALQEVRDAWVSRDQVVAGIPPWMTENWCRQNLRYLNLRATGSTVETEAAPSDAKGSMTAGPKVTSLGRRLSATRAIYWTAASPSMRHQGLPSVVQGEMAVVHQAAKVPDRLLGAGQRVEDREACHSSSWRPLTNHRMDASSAPDPSTSLLDAELIVSHCSRPLDWLSNVTSMLRGCGARVRAVHVYTKCNRSHTIGWLPEYARSVELPNVGRCDHTYAYHLASRNLKQPPPPLTFFMKDTSMAGSDKVFVSIMVPLCAQVANARRPIGFGCGRYPLDKVPLRRKQQMNQVVGEDVPLPTPHAYLVSDWHHTASLGAFRVPRYEKEHDQAKYDPAKYDQAEDEKEHDQANDSSLSNASASAARRRHRHGDGPSPTDARRGWQVTQQHERTDLTSTRDGPSPTDARRGWQVTQQHERTDLTREASAFKSVHRPLRLWLARLLSTLTPQYFATREERMRAQAFVNQVLRRPLVPVCYGGSFVAARASIEAVPHAIWVALERSLARGDNIEEGHYAERSWAALLTLPAGYPADLQSLACASHRLLCLGNSFRGALTTCAVTKQCSMLGGRIADGNYSVCPTVANPQTNPQTSALVITG